MTKKSTAQSGMAARGIGSKGPDADGYTIEDDGDIRISDPAKDGLSANVEADLQRMKAAGKLPGFLRIVSDDPRLNQSLKSRIDQLGVQVEIVDRPMLDRCTDPHSPLYNARAHGKQHEHDIAPAEALPAAQPELVREPQLVRSLNGPSLKLSR